jgi:hypothetical protein
MSDPNYKYIKQEELPRGLYISTVWIGHSIISFPGEKMKIFETKIFFSKHNLTPIFSQRYYTEQEALEGHEQLKKDYSKLNF